jgi:phosphodiesterase/alkaline phosphatase D-like protein
MKSLFILFFLHLPCYAVGFANGVKIVEFTNTSVVLWVRLTQNPEAKTMLGRDKHTMI